MSRDAPPPRTLDYSRPPSPDEPAGRRRRQQRQLCLVVAGGIGLIPALFAGGGILWTPSLYLSVRVVIGLVGLVLYPLATCVCGTVILLNLRGEELDWPLALFALFATLSAGFVLFVVLLALASFVFGAFG